MSHKFGIGKYKTRDGRDAVVVFDQMPGSQPLVGWTVPKLGNNGDLCTASSWSEDGRYSYTKQDSTGDLIPPQRWTYTQVMDGVANYNVFRDLQPMFYIETNTYPISILMTLLNAAEEAE